jgi:hypothetical protein
MYLCVSPSPQLIEKENLPPHTKNLGSAPVQQVLENYNDDGNAK